MDTHKFESDEKFESELRSAFARRPAPPGLKRKLMERRRAEQVRRSFAGWQRMAAALVLTAIMAGGVAWHNMQERRKEEQAREQLMTALRITSRALNQMNNQLAVHNRSGAQD